MKKIMILLSSIFIFQVANTRKILSGSDILEIYNNYVEPNMNETYNTRYTTIPTEKNTLPWKWKGKDLPRVIAMLEFERLIKLHNVSYAKGLAVNGIDPEWHYLPKKDITSIGYPEHDLHTLDLENKDFDFVMVNQTLEHVYDPILCLENLFNHMKTKGILYLNVPTNNIPHDTPFHHYTGFTPVGLGMMLRSAGFTILSIGQWGNKEYLLDSHGSFSWPDYTQYKNEGYNDFNYPIIAWAFAIKD